MATVLKSMLFMAQFYTSLLHIFSIQICEVEVIIPFYTLR